MINALRIWRKAQGLTQAQAGVWLGVDMRTIARWEKRPLPPRRVLLAIAAVPPEIYDVVIDSRRPVTQEELDILVARSHRLAQMEAIDGFGSSSPGWRPDPPEARRARQQRASEFLNAACGFAPR